MTSGTRVVDKTSYVNGWYQTAPSGAIYPTTGQLVGQKTSRTWSGADAPAATRNSQSTVAFSYYVRDRKTGEMILRERHYRSPSKRLRYSSSMPENPYQCTYVNNRDSLYTYRTYNAVYQMWLGGAQSTEGFPQIGVSSTSLWTPDCQYALYGRLSDSIQGSAFNMAVFLGEGREALETISGAASRITRAFRQLRKGRVSKAADELVGKTKSQRWKRPVTTKSGKVQFKDISSSKVTSEWLSSNWLQLQYGWKPLLQDIYAAARHFAWMQTRDQPMVYRARMRVVKYYNQSFSGADYALSGRVEYSKAVKAIITRINHAQLLGLLDPASLVWEKLPYSFVADWFLPIGNYLEALNLDRALSGKYVISSKDFKGTYSAQPTSSTKQYQAYFIRENFQFKREIFSSLPVPLPQFKPLEEVASFAHAANSIALLVQLFAH